MEHMKEVFDQFDWNKNGTIEKKEFYNFTLALNEPMTPAEMQDFLDAFDTDNSTTISWDEFTVYLNSLEKLK